MHFFHYFSSKYLNLIVLQFLYMFNYGNFKYFLFKVSLGLIFILISLFIYIGLLKDYSNITGFGKGGNTEEISTFSSIFGLYLSSYLIVLFSYSAYLIPTIFLVNGVRFLLGIKATLIYFRFFIIILSIFLINFCLSLININSGLVGNILKNLIEIYFIEWLNINFIKWFVFFILSFISSYLVLFGLNVRINIFNKKIISFFLIFKYILFFLTKLAIPFKLFKNKKTLTSNYNFKKNKSKRVEPTIKKNTRVNKKIFNKYEQENQNNLKAVMYELPSINLLNTSSEKTKISRSNEIRFEEFSKKLEIILKEYGVDGKIVNYKSGPVVTLYEFLPAPGIKTSKVVGLSEDIARAMSSLSTRISSQPGKTSIGIEIPNPKRESVFLGDLIKDSEFTNINQGLRLALGKNISGDKKFTDLEKMPHLLIAGTTGSGKSVGINSMIISLLYRFTPSECKLILIDPKMLELSIYEGIPHLLTPVVTNPNKAVFALKWVVKEMENRYRLMSTINVKNINSFNDKIIKTIAGGRKIFREVQTGINKETREPIIEKQEIPLNKMPLIVVVIDEMADLMMVAGKEVENLVQRLAQMARAAGIHLIAATQRPSVDVITGTIKANFPSRISFRVASRFDSRTILNEMGAEQLLGSGDMLFLENGANVTRLHGGFVSETEIENIVNHIKSQSGFEKQEDITSEESTPNNELDLGFENKSVDELYEKALSIVIKQQKVSTSYVQRYLQIGYNRAARIIEKMEEDGYISEPSHAGKRSVLKKNI